MNEPTARDDGRDGHDEDEFDDPVVVDAEEVDPEDGGLAHYHDFATAWTDASARHRATE